MIDLNRRGSEGFTIGEFLAGLPQEIDSDGEGLWSIVPTGRGFGFDGAELAEYVRLCLLRLLEAGAVPVRHSPLDESLLWKEQTQYGTQPEQIADAIVAEWLASGAGDPPWEYLWFVTREVLETARRA
ncbi:MAG: hypothetical protein WDN31_12525 [Hyphomicrobium sp.]